jgi:hypothetical protein
MARIPSVASLEKRLTHLKTREKNLAARQKSAGDNIGKGQPRPMKTFKYRSIYMATDFTINAPETSVNFFGQTALGLAAQGADPGAPRGFKPARIKAVKGKSKPTTATSKLSTRRYLKYTIEATTDTQASFTAPVSADTVANLKAKVEAIINDKKGDVGEYGRISFEPERPIFAASGSAGGTAPAA